MYQKIKTAVKLDKLNTKWLLIFIFIIALVVRFYSFHSSTYFGYDEAREAFVSQSIYRDLDFKIVGPPTTTPGVYHGPLFWYLLYPIYLLGGGEIYFVSAIFRIINALGVFLIYVIASKLFNKNTGILSAFIYTISFEQSQYSLFMIQPTLGVFAWFLITYGFASLLKDKKYSGIIPIFLGCALATQFNFFLIYTFVFSVITLLILRIDIRKIPKTIWFKTILITFGVMSSFILAEIKYNFQTTKGLVTLLTKGYDLINPSETRLSVYLENLVNVFRYNLIDMNDLLVYFAMTFIFLGLFLKIKEKPVKFLLLWIFSTILLVPFGMGEALYFNVGIGVGLIIAFSYLLLKVGKKSIFVLLSILVLVLFSNLRLIIRKNPSGLITRIKPQPYMLLEDEIAIIESVYQQTQGHGFTIRVTGIPYGVQTVWAYLFKQYGYKKYGYLPYFETGNVKGFPGVFPEPKKGTTCYRFLIQEPTRGIPVNLIEQNIKAEDDFSDILSEQYFGSFILQNRISIDENCHNDKPI